MKLSGKLSETGLEPFVEEEFVVNSRRMPKVWILVAGAEQAHFFRKTDSHLEKIGESFPKRGNESEITNKTAGRMSNPSGGGGRHRFEAHDEALNHGTNLFLKSLTDFLNQAAGKNAFDRIVLVAAPKTLGILRPMLRKPVHERINAELDKDLTHLNEKQLFDYLDKIAWV